MKKSVLVILLFLAPFLSGCFGVNNYFKSVRNDIIHHIDAGFTEDTEFALGPVTLTVAGWFVPDEEQASEFIDNISQLQVGIYKKEMNGNSNYFKLIQKIDRRMNRHGCRYIVKNCSKDEVSAIYVNRNLERGIRRMFIINIDKEEMVIVQMDGNLSKVIETAIQDRGLSYN